MKDLCEGCRQYRILIKRDYDGKLLCKRCSKNQPLKLFTKKYVSSQEKAEETKK